MPGSHHIPHPTPVPSHLSHEAKRCGDAGIAGPTEVAMGTPATCEAFPGDAQDGLGSCWGPGCNDCLLERKASSAVPVPQITTQLSSKNSSQKSCSTVET